jgi:hypothetical protein
MVLVSAEDEGAYPVIGAELRPRDPNRAGGGDRPDLLQAGREIDVVPAPEEAP